MTATLKKYLPLLAGFTAQAIFGFALYITKQGLPYVNNDTVKFLAFRFTTGFIVMSLLVLLRVVKVNYKNKPVRMILIAGLCNPMISQVLETTSTLYAPLSQIALLQSLSPIILIVIAIFLNREYPTRRQVFFVVITMMGVAVINIAGAGTEVTPMGLFLILGSLLAICFGRIFVRRAGVHFSPFEVVYVTTGMGALTFSTVSVIRAAVGGTLPHFFDGLGDPGFVIPVIYMGVGSCIVAFLCLTYATVHLPVAVFSGTTMMGKVLAIVAGVCFLHETFGLTDLIGSVIILLGVVGVSTSYDAGKDNSLKQQAAPSAGQVGKE